jgi:hypothetical protein
MNSLMVGGVTGGALRGSRSKHGLLSQSEHVSFRLTARLHSPAAVPNGKSYHSRRFKCDLSVMKHTVIPTMEFHYVRVNRPPSGSRAHFCRVKLGCVPLMRFLMG